MQEPQFFDEPSNVRTLIKNKVFEIVGYGTSTYQGISVQGQNCIFERFQSEFTLEHIYIYCAEDDSKYDIQFYIEEDECGSGWCTSTTCDFVIKEISNYDGMSFRADIDEDRRILINNDIVKERKVLSEEKFLKNPELTQQLMTRHSEWLAKYKNDLQIPSFDVDAKINAWTNPGFLSKLWADKLREWINPELPQSDKIIYHNYREVRPEDTLLREIHDQYSALLREEYSAYEEKVTAKCVDAIPALGFGDCECKWFSYSPAGDDVYYPAGFFQVNLENMEEVVYMKRAM